MTARRDRARSLPRKFFLMLRPNYSDQMAQFVFDVAGHSDGVSYLFTQQRLVALTKPVERLFDRILGHIELVCDLGLCWPVRFIHEHLFHLLKEPHIAYAAIFISQSRHHLLQDRERPAPFVDLAGRKLIAAFRLDPLSLPNVVERN